MRPVNLIPPDERRGDAAPLRTGALIYVLIAGLGLLLLGIVAVALSGKQISDRQSQKANLEQQLTAATARANSVKAFTDFRTVQANRAATVASLAQSRFDWSRVLQELARVVPSDVHLSSLTATVSGSSNSSGSSGSSSSSGGGSDLGSSVAGPTLSIQGCAPSQNAVAGFIAALEDIDGVTRVGLDSSSAPDQNSGGGFTGEPGNAATSGGSDGCSDFDFTILAAFDAVPAPSAATPPPTAPSAPATPTANPTSNDGVSDGQSEIASANASARAQSSKANQAVHTALRGGN
jgi:Tfp pilus assembly protein PilN